MDGILTFNLDHRIDAHAIRRTDGGPDANWRVRHGFPTVTFDAGQNEARTVDAWINLDDYERACALAVRLATMG